MTTSMVVRRMSLAAALVLLLTSLAGVPAAGADRRVDPAPAWRWWTSAAH